MSAPRQAILLDARTGWRTGSAVNVGTLGAQGLHLTGSGGTAGAFAAMPAWLAAPAWAPGRGTGDLLVYLLGRDGWVRRLRTGHGRLPRDLQRDGLRPGGRTHGVAASREDVYLLDTRQARVLVMSGLGYPRQILRPPAPWTRCGLRPARRRRGARHPGRRRGGPLAPDRILRCSRVGSAWARGHGPGSPRAAMAGSTSSTPPPRWPRSSARTVRPSRPPWTGRACWPPSGRPAWTWTRPGACGCRAWPAGWTGPGSPHASRPPPP